MLGAKAQVYVDFLVVTIMGMLLIALLSYLASTIYQRAIKVKIREELNLLANEIITSIIRYHELGRVNLIRPRTNTKVLLGLFHLNLPETISGRMYKVTLLPANGLWINILNISANGIDPSNQIEGANPKIKLATIESPIIEVERVLPNLGVYLKGEFRSGDISLLHYWRHNRNGTIYDSIELGGVPRVT